MPEAKEQIIEQILKSPRLPSLPTIALEVIDLVQRQDVNIKQIAATIHHDPALSTKILKTVNSSFYGQTHAISTVSHALVVLGLNSVKTLALGFSLVGNLQAAGGQGLDHRAFWRRSLYSAVATRALATQLGLVQQEEAFLGGLLQDLGMLAMNQTLGRNYRTIIEEAGDDHRSLARMERDAMDTDHAEIGAALAEAWRLPPLLVEPIRYHEDPTDAPAELLPLIRCIVLGSRAADVLDGPNPGESLETFHRLGDEWFGLSPEQSEPMLKSIHTGTVEMHHLLELPDDEFGNPDEILARANEALLQLSLQQQQATSQLEAERVTLQKEKRELIEQASTDPLTGIANRRSFRDFSEKAFVHTRDTGEPMTVLFLDTDHFKQFNDTYGHQVGDRVLVSLAQLLQDSAPEHAMVSRYGGEEFAVILPNTDRITGARHADQTRVAIEHMTVESDDGKPLTITASIGVATYVGEVFANVQQVVKAADQAVYAAKESGRNCVRVFSPQPHAKAS